MTAPAPPAPKNSPPLPAISQTNYPDSHNAFYAGTGAVYFRRMLRIKRPKFRRTGRRSPSTPPNPPLGLYRSPIPPAFPTFVATRNLKSGGMLFRVLLFLVLLSSFTLHAQPGGQGGGGMRGGGQGPMGRFYGKIVDQKTKKGVEFATVTLFQNKFDSASRTMKRKLITGQLTEPNGDFSLENVPVRGKYIVRIQAIGYDSLVQEVTFGNSLDKDLGNLALVPRMQTVDEVVVDGSAPAVELKPDRRVYNMEKSDIATGGTAEDALNTIPTVKVDMDGNVTLRNSSPQIFIDGRPTTFTLDQIPADAIQSIEVITAPSAKYDASGGGAGIINIVLKKDRRVGYNGNVRTNVDMRGRVGGGGDLNVRQGKVNAFISGNVNQRRSISEGETTRLNLFESPQTDVLQTSRTVNDNIFINGRAGVDYFIDNRNTLTLSGSYTTGRFNSNDEQSATTDTLHTLTPITTSRYDRHSESFRMFENFGGSLLYKRLFTKEGKEWTADINYNHAGSDNQTLINTEYFDNGQDVADRNSLQKQTGGGYTRFLTGQTDFSVPLNDKMKMETGARFAVRNFVSGADVFVHNPANGLYELVPNPYSDYEYLDNVYAGYGTFSHAVNAKFSYQLGLRLESSDYHGTLSSTGQTFRNFYPASLFPSGYLSYKPNDKHDFQLNASRRINRPNFFQLMPFTDYTDSLNLSRGNPSLKPEFTYRTEFTYMRNFSKETNVLASVYYRYTEGLITRYQVMEFDSSLERDALVNTYENASSSYVTGGDVSATIAIKKWLELNPSVSAYYSDINGTNIATNLKNDLFSWSAEMNLTFRLPKNIVVQASADYDSRRAVTSGGGGRSYSMGGMGGGGMWGGNPGSLQGYTIPSYELDLSIRYSFLKNKAANIILNVSDVFKTNINGSHTESEFFVQDSRRVRDQQFFRLSFSYRFGKMDASLFKRKNTKSSSEGMDMGM